ncbi:TPA: hypothetical protein QCX08_003995 [Bacillus cytotoxicus]|nr:hypothetical protein [Bacillus cytotoxicus]HDR7866117.1 hypothetical protein [Bacillus cytotoxicus]
MTTKNEQLHNEVTVVEETVSNPFDVVKADNVTPAIFEQSNQLFFSSIQNDGSRESQIKIYNAVSDADNSLQDHVGEVIEITDMVAHTITLEDEVTKEDVEALRVVLIAKDGTAYHAISQGVVSSLQRIIAIVGQAPWNPSLKVVPVEKKTRKGYRTLTLKLQA